MPLSGTQCPSTLPRTAARLALARHPGSHRQCSVSQTSRSGRQNTLQVAVPLQLASAGGLGGGQHTLGGGTAVQHSTNKPGLGMRAENTDNKTVLEAVKPSWQRLHPDVLASS